MRTSPPKGLVRLTLPKPRRQEASIERIARRLGRPLPNLPEPEEEVTPAAGYRVVDGKIVDVAEAIPSNVPAPGSAPAPAPAPAIPPAPPIPPFVFRSTWEEPRGERIRKAIFFTVMAVFLVSCVVGATWAFLWQAHGHQQLLDHQREEHERQRRLGYE